MVRIPNEGGEVDRALRPGLAALRVAGYPAVCVCKRGEMPVFNIFTPLVSVIREVYHTLSKKENQSRFELKNTYSNFNPLKYSRTAKVALTSSRL